MDDPRNMHENHNGSMTTDDSESPSASPSPSRQDIWNDRYSGADRVWSAGPNRDVESIVSDLPPGTAIDLGAGEGRHAIWLAERGWRVTAVDFAESGLERGRREAEDRGLTARIDWVAADVTTWTPPAPAYDLILIAFLHLPEDVFSRARSWVGPGGHLVVVGHALRNLTEGSGGPQDPALLHTPNQLREKAVGLEVVRCEEVERITKTGERAIDVVLVARKA